MLTSSITFALSTDEQPVPGIDALRAPVLFVLVRRRVQNWIGATRDAVGRHGVIVIADDDWVNPDPEGIASITVPAGELDVEALAAIRRKLAKTGKEGEDA